MLNDQIRLLSRGQGWVLFKLDELGACRTILSIGQFQMILLDQSRVIARSAVRQTSATHGNEGPNTWIASSFFLVPLGGNKVRMSWQKVAPVTSFFMLSTGSHKYYYVLLLQILPHVVYFLDGKEPFNRSGFNSPKLASYLQF